MEKTISVRRTTITFSIWDLGGQREFVNMLPLVCNDAVAILFMFDLSRKSTLNSVKEWYRQARGFNKVGFAISRFGGLISRFRSLRDAFLMLDGIPWRPAALHTVAEILSFLKSILYYSHADN
jgi:GTPase SAR1 family protein